MPQTYTKSERPTPTQAKKSMFSIPIGRALLRDEVADLLKAGTRGPKAGTKYLRRIPYMHNGKLEWRYIYKNAKQRNAGRKQHADTEAEHHITLKELADLFPKLKRMMRSATHSDASQIQDLLDAAEITSAAKVSLDPKFRELYQEPFVAKERAGEETERSPMARAAQAVSMLPDHIKGMLAVKIGSFDGLKDLKFITQDNPDHVKVAKQHGVPPEMIGGYARDSGATRISAGADPKSGYGAVGDPEAGGKVRYLHPKIKMECIIWHELAHNVHYAMEQLAVGKKPKDWPKDLHLPDKDAIAEWQSMFLDGNEKISGYAETNWKEDFAETFAAAMAVPQELARRCPERYNYMKAHVLPHLPDIETTKAMPHDELAWWRGEHGAGTSLFHRARHANPQPRFTAFYSPKDQFYGLQKDGRHLYVRFGPLNPEEESGWDRMPDTIDPKTGLPVSDSRIALKFRSQGRVKEIFDEHGNALTDAQAFFYLSQNDPEFVAQLEEIQRTHPGENMLESYEHWVDEQRGKGKKITHLLSEKLYLAFGQSKANTDAIRKQEREKVLKRQKEGKVGKTGLVFDRFQWAPVEVSEHEFMLKSGTFQFGNIRPAKEQPWVRLVDGKVSIGPDGVPERAATVYEQENADGTIFQVTVAEGEPFSHGDLIVAPKLVTDPQTGAQRYSWPEPPEAWYEIKPGEEDAEQLARKFKITVDELLKKNQKFRKGQILDPLMASLINPYGEDIKDAAALDYLMRMAAREEPETWVTVRSGKTAKAPYVQIKVKYDGAGPPLVLGEYWARKLGKAEGEPVRIDELLTPDDELKIKAKTVRERPPKKLPAKRGYPVWVTVRDSYGKNKRVMATLVKRTKGAYVVSVLPGQGPGLPVGIETPVAQVRAVGEEEIPGRPGVRRRFIEPLPNDILVYMDHVGVGSAESEPDGLIKILPPSDGSWTMEDIAAVQGVRILQDAEDEAPSLVISPRDLPKLREQLGGVVMDSRVQASFELNASQERARIASAQTEPWPPSTAFEDENGNVAPEGVLKGLVVGDDGMQPGEHRIEALQKLAQNGGRLYAAHFMGTGKTALGIAASQMMRNLRDKDDPTRPHPNQLKKKTLAVVPINTANNWEDEVEFFTGSKASVVGNPSSVAGAAKMFVPKPGRGPEETDEEFHERAIAAWKEAVKPGSPTYKAGLYNPWADDSDTVVIPYEYFRIHEELLRATGLFDGMIVDEAHNIAKENELSKAVERWNKDMKMMLLLSGTPITNTLDVIPRIVNLTTAGQVNLGTPEEFQENYLVESAVKKAAGQKKAAKMDINPQKVGELAGILQPLMHVALSQDVKGKVMPAVLLDENNPAHMVKNGQQARMYRFNMAQMTPDELASMTESAAVGTDELDGLSETGRRKVAVARNIANCAAYKAPDQQEFMVWVSVEPKISKKTGKQIGDETREVKRIFKMPDYKKLVTGKPKGWGGHWPTMKDVENGLVQENYYKALSYVYETMFGETYESVQGKPIKKEILEGVKKDKGGFITSTGAEYGKVRNPDYGPEGMICRGDLKPDGTVEPLHTTFYNHETGAYEDIEIPVGKRFIRDPNAKAEGIFFDDGDWDFTGRFDEDVEGMTKKKGDKGKEIEEDDEIKKERKKHRGKKQQAVDPSLNVQNSPKRRRERTVFDKVVTHGNAKCDKLEEYIKTSLKKEHLGPDQQFIVFGNRIGASCRTVEAKLRTMGYQDVNEVLGHPDVSGPGDKAKPGVRKYFVSYMGRGATKGDRDLNSEIFRQRKDKFGKNTGQSNFVYRSLYGTTGKPPKVGEFKAGWTEGQRKRIANAFQDHRRKNKDGTPAGMEMPLVVTRVDVAAKGPSGEPQTEYRYVYESDLKASRAGRKALKQIEQLRRERRGAPRSRKRAIDKQLAAIYKNHLSDRLPLDDHQQHVMNNTQFMVASDAANVGLNWPAPQLIMYDSLFSPMDEWQRITRAARMLPAVTGNPNVAETQQKMHAIATDKKLTDEQKDAKLGKLKGEYESRMLANLTHRLSDMITETEEKNGLKEYSFDTAVEIVQSHIDQLDPDEREFLTGMEGGGPDQLMEAIFALRAFDKIEKLRKPVRESLRRHGHVPDKSKPVVKFPPEKRTNWVPPAAIQNSDVMNEIVREHLTPFEFKLLQGRKYLVHVTRLTTSVDVPVFETKQKVVGGKKVKIKVPTGEWEVEAPTMAERSQLTQGRAKMVPFERFLKLVQDAQPTFTDFDTLPVPSDSLGGFGRMPDKVQAKKDAAVARRKRIITVPVFDEKGKVVDRYQQTAKERAASYKELRRKEREERKRVKAEWRAAEAERKKALRAQRAAESRERARKKRAAAKKKKKTKKSLLYIPTETFYA